MKSWDVRVVDAPSSPRPIMVELEGTSEDIAVTHSLDKAEVELRISPEEAFALGLALLRKAAQVGVILRQSE